jgi:hypothetical protein
MTKKRTVEEDEDKCAPRKTKKIKFIYTLEELKKEIIKENEAIDRFNLITQNNQFLENNFFIGKVFKEIENKESFDIENYIYKLNLITCNGKSPCKIGEIEIDPILIKTRINFFILQNIDDDTDLDIIKKNFLKKDFSKIIILLDETIELRNDNFQFTSHSFNINWTINDKWKREKFNKYYWGYQVIKPPLFINNFGYKDTEEKIIKYNNGCINNNIIKAEMDAGLKNIRDQVMGLFKELGKDCPKN